MGLYLLHGRMFGISGTSLWRQRYVQSLNKHVMRDQRPDMAAENDHHLKIAMGWIDSQYKIIATQKPLSALHMVLLHYITFTTLALSVKHKGLIDL